MVYLTVSRGFKSGGYNLGLGGSFNPEKITDYEGGFKGDFLNRTLRVNAAAFYYDYKDLQVVKIANQTVSAAILNAAAAKLYGGELQITAAPFAGLRVDLALSGLRSQFTTFNTVNPAYPQLGEVDLSGNRLPGAPEYTATVGIEYAFGTPFGEFTPRVESSTISQIFWDQYNAPTVSTPGYTRWNLFLNYTSPGDGRYYASLYVRNLGNLTRVSGEIVSEGFEGFPFNSAFIPPRTFGLKLGMNFK